MSKGKQVQEQQIVMDILEIGLVPVYQDDNGERLINARELHDFLADKQDFSTWIKAKLKKYGFVENVDYLIHNFMEQLPSGAKNKIDYILKLEVAKEIAMVQNNERGREVRQYFIEVEKRYQAKAEQELALYKAQDQLALRASHAAELSKADATMTQSAVKICKSYGMRTIDAAIFVHNTKSSSVDFDTAIANQLKVIETADSQKRRDRLYVRAHRLGTCLRTAFPDMKDPYEEAWHFMSNELIFEAGTKKSLRKRHGEDKKTTEEANAGRRRGEPKVKCPGYLDYIQEGNLYKEAETVLNKLLKKYSKLAAKVEQAKAAEQAANATEAPAELA